jgi:MarR family transcriptional regulator, organic hydroperoxide resistance regulator
MNYSLKKYFSGSPMPVKLILNNPKLKAWHLSHQALNSLVKCEEELFVASGLYPQQFAVLMAVKDSPDPVTQKDVANWLDRNTNSISQILDRMVKDELIERIKDLQDGRAVRLIISPKGEKIYQQGCQLASGLISEILSDLSDNEIQTFIGILEKIQDKTFLIRRLKDKVKLIQSAFGEDLITLFPPK